MERTHAAAMGTESLIVKSGLDDFPGLAANEFVCMTMARQAGIPTPDFHLSEDRKLFVVHRFDRIEGRAIGFEDMAALGGKDASAKYSGRYEAVARLLGYFCGEEHRKQALVQLFDQVALSCIVGNGDAHLKNFGMLYDDPASSDVRMAPAFDIVCTTCYLPQDTLALSLAGGRSFFASRQLLLDFAPTCNLTAAEATRRIEDLVEVAHDVRSELSDLVDYVPGMGEALDRGISAFAKSFQSHRATDRKSDTPRPERE